MAFDSRTGAEPRGEGGCMSSHLSTITQVMRGLGLGLCIIFAAACAGTTSPSPTELTTVRFSYDWVPDSDWAAVVWADELGYFAENGVEVEYLPGDPTLLEKFATQQFDMAQVPGPFMVQAHAEGLPFTVVGVTMPESPLVVVADGALVSEVEDIEGKRVAVQVGEFEEFVWAAWAAANGIDRSSVEEIPAGGLGDILFIEGQVDVMMDFYSSGSMVPLTEEHPGEETLFLVSDTQQLVGQSVGVHNEFLSTHPDAVRGFLAGWARGANYMIEHPDESMDLMLERFEDLDQAGVEWSTAAFIEFWTGEQFSADGMLSFTPEMWESTKKLLVDTDQIEETDITDMYTTEYLPDPPIFPS